MRVKIPGFAIGAVLLLAGCSNSHSLTSAGQQVRVVEKKPASECQLLAHVTGQQSNWLAGSDESSSLLGAANDLRNKAAAMGGNVIYNLNSPSQSLLSSFVPLASKMSADVYKCP